MSTLIAFFQGGLITWKPVDAYTNASTVDILITEIHSWTLSRFPCSQSLINSLGLYADTSGGGADAFVACQTLVTSCTGTGFATISDYNYCTDYSNTVQISSGSLIKKVTLSRSTNIVVGFTGSAWATVIIQSGTVSTSASNWAVVTRINLGTKYPINSSPGIFLQQ